MLIGLLNGRMPVHSPLSRYIGSNHWSALLKDVYSLKGRNKSSVERKPLSSFFGEGL